MVYILVVPVDRLVLMLSDDVSVVLDTTNPISVLKTKHLRIGFHCVREAIDASLSSETFYKLLIIGVPSHVRKQDMVLKIIQVDEN